MQQLDRHKTQNCELNAECECLKSTYEQGKNARDEELLMLHVENERLKADILAAGAEARETLQQAFEAERAELEEMLNVQQRVQNNLESMRVRAAARVAELGQQSAAQVPQRKPADCEDVRIDGHARARLG
ncbi:hypothetical protein B0H17DRAFT_1150120 [Mycena rosella]|uniref:Uncharacterized protein n=1 Tax=Mycena rosella TaxID=1033263 RepID=A0AAD7BWN4_MYCRO|nr:hypothetical protein B0H17DRAFT_1150120 [Mycena rosella]